MKQITIYKRFLIIACAIWFTAAFSGTASIEKYEQEQKVKAVIFDLGGVLLGHSMLGYLRTIGVVVLLKYLVTGHNPKNMLKKFFEILHQIKPLDPNGPASLTPDGSQALPQLFREWLTGKQSNAQLRKEATDFIDTHPEIFSGSVEQQFMRKAVNIIFSPTISARRISPYKGSVQLIKWCKNLGLDVFVLSNFDAESYEILKEKYSDLFDLFEEENIFISGKLGTMKPEPEIFNIVINCGGFDPAEYLFFDDQKENIEAAKTSGLNAMQVTMKKQLLGSSPDYEEMRTYLSSLLEKQSDVVVA